MSLYMTPDEIRRRYRNLDPKHDRIELLAELNCCKESEIIEVLQLEPQRKKTLRRGQADPEYIQELYDQGLNDKEIGALVHRHYSLIQKWRARNGLAPNAKRGRQARRKQL